MESTICWTVWRTIARPQLGQWGCRARITGGALLIDRDRGRETVDVVHVRFLHQTQELASIGGQGFDVPALALGVNGIERQGRLPRPGDAGDDDELVPRNLDVDVLQIVLARSSYDDGIKGHSDLCLRPPRRERLKLLVYRDGPNETTIHRV